MPQYVIMTIGWYERFWWTEDEFESNCTAKQRESVLAFTLAATDETFISDVNATTTPGIVSHCCTMPQELCFNLVLVEGWLSQSNIG